jgi:hypothetical protein
VLQLCSANRDFHWRSRSIVLLFLLLLIAAAGVIEEAEGLGGSARLTHPIRCRVSGGYTISKLQGFRGADSPESLLTCILQVRRYIAVFARVVGLSQHVLCVLRRSGAIYTSLQHWK